LGGAEVGEENSISKEINTLLKKGRIPSILSVE